VLVSVGKGVAVSITALVGRPVGCSRVGEGSRVAVGVHVGGNKVGVEVGRITVCGRLTGGKGLIGVCGWIKIATNAKHIKTVPARRITVKTFIK
jgi:hypothetical protein